MMQYVPCVAHLSIGPLAIISEDSVAPGSYSMDQELHCLYIPEHSLVTCIKKSGLRPPLIYLPKITQKCIMTYTEYMYLQITQ